MAFQSHNHRVDEDSFPNTNNQEDKSYHGRSEGTDRQSQRSECEVRLESCVGKAESPSEL